MMTIECVGADTSLLATSSVFHVYDAPSTTAIATGLRAEVLTEFSYEGRLEPIIPLINAFQNGALTGQLTCNQCPRGRE